MNTAKWNKETLFESFKQAILSSVADANAQMGSLANASAYIKDTEDFKIEFFVEQMKSYVNQILHDSTWDAGLYNSRLYFDEDTGFSIKAA